jgi:hypothetical protein
LISQDLQLKNIQIATREEREDLNFDIRLSSDKVISNVDITFSNNLLTKVIKRCL